VVEKEKNEIDVRKLILCQIKVGGRRAKALVSPLAKKLGGRVLLVPPGLAPMNVTNVGRERG